MITLTHIKYLHDSQIKEHDPNAKNVGEMKITVEKVNKQFDNDKQLKEFRKILKQQTGYKTIDFVYNTTE